MAQYIGNSPETILLKTKRDTYTYTSTSGQTVFSGTDNDSKLFVSLERSQVLVYLNGLLLEPNSYTVGSTSVVLDTGVASGVEVVIFTEIESALVNSPTRVEVNTLISTAIAAVATELNDLTDVDLTTTPPTDGQALIWDNATSTWIPGDSFSQTDFDSAFTFKDTDDLSEGTTNLYYTDARVDARVTALDLATETYVDTTVSTAVSNLVSSAPAALDTLNELAQALGDDANFSTTITNSIATKLSTADFTSTADTWIGTKDTDDLSEGTTNLYYTAARSRGAISATGDLTYNSATGELGVTTYKTSDFNTDLASSDTDDLSEGLTNLYYTDARVGTYLTTNDYATESFVTSAVAAKDNTDEISEGLTNLYYTDARVGIYLNANSFATETYVNNTISAKDSDDFAEGSTNLYYTDARVGSYLNANSFATETYVNNTISAKDSDDFAEGLTNLYYTDARVGSYLNANLFATETYVNNTISAKDSDDFAEGSTNLYYTDARVGTYLNANSFATETYVNNTISAKDSDDFAEGSTNLYFTQARVSSYLDVNGFNPTDEISITDLGITDGVVGQVLTTDGAGNFTFEDGATPTTVSGTAPSSPEQGDLWFDNVTTGQLYTYVGTSWLSTAGLTTLEYSSVGDLSDVDLTVAPVTGQALVWDGSKFIPGDSFSQTDFDNAFTAKDTDDLSEGSTNLYYTDARADARIAVASSNYATAAQGALADTALQAADLTGYATETYVGTAISNLIDTAPTTLDTLNELAAALGDDPNFATTVATSIGTKLATADFTSTADTWIGTKDTDALSEGSTNLYYTDARVSSYLTTNTYATESYVTTAISGKADSSSLATVATTGEYSDLLNQPSIPSVLTDIGIVDGTIGQILTTDGAGGFIFEDAAEPLVVSGTAPASPSEGALWFDNVNTGQLYAYVGTSWLSTAGLTTLEYSSVGDLSDVDLTVAPTDGQTLIWDNANSKFIAGTIEGYTVLDFNTDLAASDTDDLSEGSTNLYYTDARATAASRSAISAGGDLSYDSGTGVISYTTPDISSTTVSGTAPVAPSEGDLWFDNVTTGQLYTYVGSSWLSTAGITTLEFSSVGDLGDVDLVTNAPTDGQTLIWDSVNSKFIPADVAVDFTGYATETYVNTSISTASSNYATSAQGALADTALQTTDLTGYATETYVGTAISNLIDSAPGALDTLNELAAALGDDANFATTTANAISLKANSADLGTAAAQDVGYFATAAQGTLAGTALQSVAFADLTSTPTTLVGYGITDSFFDGAYGSLTGAPTIPSVLTDLSITDGTIGQVLTTDGSGNFTFEDTAGGAIVISGTAPSSPSEGDLWFDNVTTGELYVYADSVWQVSSSGGAGAIELSELGDVDTTTVAPTDGQALVWDNANSTWVPGTIVGFDGAYSSLTGTPTIPSAITDLAITDGTVGQVLTTDGAGAFTFEDAASPYGDSEVGIYLSTNGFDTAANIVASIVDTAPGTLDTLNELAAALGDDANFATTITNSISLKANSADLGTAAAEDVGYFATAAQGTLADTALQSVAFSDLGIADGTIGQVLTTDGAGAFTFEDASTPTIVSGTAPSSPSEGDLWFDNVDTGMLYIYEGGAWIVTSPSAGGGGASVEVSGTAPVSPSEGDLWFDNVTTGQLYTYVGTNWLSTAGLATLEYSSVGDLSDVDITTTAPTDGQALIWDAVNSKFVSGTIAGFDQADFNTALDTISADIIPATDVTYDLGSPTKRFKDLYLSGNSIYLGDGLVISNASGSLVISDGSSNALPVSLATNTTSDLAEGTNLYYTDTRVGSYLSNNGYDTASNIVASIVDTAPATLDTLNELAAALGDDANFSTTVTTALSTKLTLSELTSSDLDMGANKILYSNVYPTELDLPVASSYHGMFAHVHATGRGYFAHAGSWVALANESELTAKADVSSLATVATTGDYDDLLNLPTIPVSINDLSDVDLTVAPTDGQALVWDNANNKFIAGTIVSGGGGGASVVVSGTAPSSPSEGDLWFDNVNTGMLYIYEGGAWAVTSPSAGGGGASVEVSGTAPSSPSEGDLWYEGSTTGELYIYDGTQWVSTNNAASRFILNDGIDVAAFTGDDTTTTFSTGYTGEVGASDIIVTQDGIIQRPTTDYSLNNSGNLVFTSAPVNGIVIASRLIKGGYTNNWQVASSNYSAVAGNKLFVDTSSSAVTVTLPANASMGDEVVIVDAEANAGTNNITVSRNGHNIEGVADDFLIDINGASIKLAYYNVARGWLIVNS